MGIVALIVRLLIAATFAVAGIAKLANVEKNRKTIRDFGLPDWSAAPLGILLPVVELAAAALLLPQSTVFWGDLAAIALLLAFIVAIGINLSLGRKPECNCFGQVHSEPIGWPTLIRNILLLAGASFVLWNARIQPPMSIFGWLADLSPVGMIAVLLGALNIAVISIAVWLAFHLFQQNGRLLLRMDALQSKLASGGAALATPAQSAPAGPPLGSPAPFFDLPQLKGGATMTLHTLLTRKKPIVLIFSDPDCGPCAALLPEIESWQQKYNNELSIALVSRGSREANRLKIGKRSIQHVLLQKDREVASSYLANGTPAAILIAVDGRIASALALGSPAIANLVAAATSLNSIRTANGNGSNGGPAMLSAGPTDLEIGKPAPEISLPDLSGRIVELSGFRGRNTLVLFWNPTCGFCSKMLPDLKSWEAQRSANAPQLLVVSTGTAEANRAMGLNSPVLLDQNFATGRAFQVRGTPAAVLLDADGNHASGVASGAPSVLALANSSSSQRDLSGVYSQTT